MLLVSRLCAGVLLLSLLLFFPGGAQSEQFVKIALNSSLTDLEITAITWPSAGVVMAVGYDSVSLSSRVWRSADHGVTWAQVLFTNNANRHHYALASKTISGTIYHITAEAMATVYVSSGTAAAWTAVNTGIGSAVSVCGIAIGSNGNAFIAGAANIVARASDSSAYSTWSVLSTGAAGGTNWFDISTFDGINVILVGNAGRVYYSPSSGDTGTWTAGSSGTSGTIYCVAHASASFAMAAGTKGYLAKSSDSGATWTNMTAFSSAYTAQYHSISVLSATEAYVAAFPISGASAGQIYRTTDGSTWSLFATTDVQLHSLGMYSSTYGVAGASAGQGVLTLATGSPYSHTSVAN